MRSAGDGDFDSGDDIAILPWIATQWMVDATLLRVRDALACHEMPCHAMGSWAWLDFLIFLMDVHAS